MITSAAAAFLSLVFCGWPSDENQDVASIEERILTNRRKIISGNVHLESKGFYSSRNEVKYVNKEVTIWFDGEKIRSDTKLPYMDDAEHAGQFYREINCYANNKHIMWSDKVFPLNGRLSLRIDETGGSSDHKKTDKKIAHPRLIGMIPVDSANLAKYHLDSIVGQSAREAPSLQYVMYQGLNCCLIKYTAKSNAKISMWISPEFDYNPLRMESEVDVSGDRYHNSVECRLGQLSDNTAWLPEWCHYTMRLNDRLVQEEQLKIKLNSVNVPLPADIFTVDGLGIPSGIHITRLPRDPRGEVYWDGKKIVPATADQYFNNLPSKTIEHRLTYYIIGFQFVAALAMICWYIIKKRHSRISSIKTDAKQLPRHT